MACASDPRLANLVQEAETARMMSEGPGVKAFVLVAVSGRHDVSACRSISTDLTCRDLVHYRAVLAREIARVTEVLEKQTGSAT